MAFQSTRSTSVDWSGLCPVLLITYTLLFHLIDAIPTQHIDHISGLISEAEERVVASFMDVGAGERRTLADIILEKVGTR